MGEIMQRNGVPPNTPFDAVASTNGYSHHSDFRQYQGRLSPDDPKVIQLLDNALRGAQRGAALTQRMLAFARRQELKLAAFDVPELVRGMTDLLQRSLGSTVQIETALGIQRRMRSS